MKTPTEHFLLASASPRRRELLALTGWHAEIQPANIAEHPLPGERPESFVKRLALLKAQASADAHSNQHWVLAADTIVVDKETILGKPADQKEAEQMLVQLAGHSHLVITAIAVLDLQSGRNIVEICRTHVPMREYGKAEPTAFRIEPFIRSTSNK
jgi:septum formation protein